MYCPLNFVIIQLKNKQITKLFNFVILRFVIRRERNFTPRIWSNINKLFFGTEHKYLIANKFKYLRLVILRLVKLTTSLPGVIILNILAVYLACSMPNTDSILMTKFIEYNIILEVYQALIINLKTMYCGPLLSLIIRHFTWKTSFV